jgi:ferritin
MLSKTMEDALNKQINAELFSAYLYLSMSAYLEEANLPGAATWMRAQSDEENAHAMAFYDFIVRRGGRVKLDAIEKPKDSWKSLLEVFEDTLEHEQKVTKMIHDLVDLSHKENDHPSASFLQKFVDEQVEEEDTANEMLDRAKLVGENPGGLYMFDRELGSRQGAE